MKSVKQAKRAQSRVAAPEPHKAVILALPPNRLGLKSQALLPAAAFFLLYVFCLASWINVGLIYHGSGQVQDFPNFYWSWDFLREFQTRPGGAAEYGSAFLVQALYS